MCCHQKIYILVVFVWIWIDLYARFTHSCKSYMAITVNKPPTISYPFRGKKKFGGIVYGKLKVGVRSHVVSCSYIRSCSGTVSRCCTCVETQIFVTGFQTPSKISWGSAVLKNRTLRCEQILLATTLLAREEENHPPQIWQLILD